MTIDTPTQPLSASPHAHDRSSVTSIMLSVCVALLPATVWGIYLFGWPALVVWVLSCLTAVISEAVCLAWQQRPLRHCFDGSALLTGWLLAVTLPPWSPWWLVVGGSCFAIIIGKHIYGGIGQNPFNPALLARTALLISFPVQMTTWVSLDSLATSPDFWASLQIIFQTQPIPDGLTGATLLGASKAAVSSGTDLNSWLIGQDSFSSLALGIGRGSLGETSELLILLGGLGLLFRGIISWHIPFSLLTSLALLAAISHGMNPERYAPAWFHLTTGGVVLGAFFFATDYVTTPTSQWGKVIFGAGCGVLIFVIRTWGGFPEAVAFAILFMNTLAPLIDRVVRPRVYGRTLTGKAIKHVSARKVL